MTTNQPGSLASLGSIFAAALPPPTPLARLGALAYSSPPALTAFSHMAPQQQWIAVRERFAQFHRNLALTPAQRADGLTKRNGIVGCLNRAYYGSQSETEHGILVGSWGKDTMTRPPRDVDVCFVLPVETYNRFQAYRWGRQSALLQEVKGKLAATYPSTEMSGDGQVVVVKFATYNVEVVPAFALTTPGQYWICDTNDGGSYRTTAPWAEINQLDAADKANAGNLRPLIRMAKAWQDWCSVPLKSFQLELLATQFISQSPWRLKDWFWFDWLLRDFFAFLYGQANNFVCVPGTGEWIALGDAWRSRALSAYQRAVNACDYERDNWVSDAGDEWQKIFGTAIPRTV